jgi:ribosomal protein S12 methylthiotransferase
MEFVPKSYSLIDELQRKKVHLVSLGCPKNRVDSELMIGQMQARGYALTDAPEDADVLVVNTCAFIDSAKQESIDTILDLAEYKAAGSASRLVVTGCMAQRYGHELAGEMPEVDYFLGTNEFKRIADALDGTLPDREYISYGSALYSSDEDRINSVRGASAYVKIAEGCNRTCSFCIIPKIRGKQVSRPLEDIVREVQALAVAGVKEINLIAQDLTSYGVDIGLRGGLELLLERLEPIRGIAWIRLHYAYPWGFTDGLLEQVRTSSKIVPYMDMPLQHISDRMLKLMRRAVRADDQRRLLERLREIDGMVLRTTLITGFPGETEHDFELLHRWIQEVEFDHVGVFAYSLEENTSAFDLPDRVDEALAAERRDILMATQQAIAKKRNQRYIGRELDVLIDGVSEEHEYVLEGRHYGQAMDIDGVTFLSFEEDAPVAMPGEMVRVEIDDASEYDLVGVVIDRKR